MENNIIILSTQFGVTINYDGDHYLSAGIPDDYKDKVEGKTFFNLHNAYSFDMHLRFFYKNNFVRTRGSFLLKI